MNQFKIISTVTVRDIGGNERSLEVVGRFKCGVIAYRETGNTGVVGDDADGVRLYSDLESYLEALPETDRAEARDIFGGAQ